VQAATAPRTRRPLAGLDGQGLGPPRPGPDGPEDGREHDGDLGSRGRDTGTVKQWVELGAAIMYDKPLVFLVLGGQPISAWLERVADEIVRVPNGSATTTSSGAWPRRSSGSRPGTRMAEGRRPA
jgi:hypothetical protein